MDVLKLLMSIVVQVSNPMTRSGESTRNELAHSSEFFIAQSDKV
jgi:hypothetical protein